MIRLISTVYCFLCTCVGSTGAIQNHARVVFGLARTGSLDDLGVLEVNSEDRWPWKYENTTSKDRGQLSSWIIPRNATEGTICSPANQSIQSYLTVEVWDVDKLYSPMQGVGYSADTMLLLATGVIPKASYTENGELLYDPPLSSTDDDSGAEHDVTVRADLGSYQRVTISTTDAEDQQSDWYVSLFFKTSTDKEAKKTRLRLKATCHSQVYPEPCIQAQQDGSENGTCICDPQFEEIGCLPQIHAIQAGEIRHNTLPVRQWTFFVYEAPSYNTGCLAHMNGISGDPILFAKRIGWGTIEDTQLPTLADYQRLADFQSIADMSRIQNRVIQSRGPDSRNQCLIGIYNSASRLNKSSEFELLIEELGDRPHCPSQCSFHGRCIITLDTYYCQCDQGFSGVRCEAEERKLLLNFEYVGTLLPGQAIYFRLFTPSYNLLSRLFEVSFQIKGYPIEGTHPIVALSKHGVPRISSDALPGPGMVNFTGDITWQLNIRHSDYDELVFGIFNVDFYVHSAFQYGFEVRVKEQGWSFGIFVRFILGMTLSLTFCLLGVLCNVLVRRYRSRPQTQPIQEEPPESPPPLLEPFQYSKQSTTNQNERMEPSPQRSDDSMDACCTICFSEFVDDEWLVRLPCGHRFHNICITQWLQRSRTCPICRCTSHTTSNR